MRWALLACLALAGFSCSTTSNGYTHLVWTSEDLGKVDTLAVCYYEAKENLMACMSMDEFLYRTQDFRRQHDASRKEP